MQVLPVGEVYRTGAITVNSASRTLYMKPVLLNLDAPASCAPVLFDFNAPASSAHVLFNLDAPPACSHMKSDNTARDDVSSIVHTAASSGVMGQSVKSKRDEMFVLESCGSTEFTESGPKGSAAGYQWLCDFD